MMTAWRTCQSLQRAASPGMRNCPAISMKLATMVIMNRCPGGQSSIPETQSTCKCISPPTSKGIYRASLYETFRELMYFKTFGQSYELSHKSCFLFHSGFKYSSSYKENHHQLTVVQTLQLPYTYCTSCRPAVSLLSTFLQSLPTEAFHQTARYLFFKRNVG